MPGAIPGPTSTVPGVSRAAEEPDPAEKERVVPEIEAVELGNVTRGCVGITDSEDADDVWLMLTTPVPVAGL